jgi:hypothetical protein
MNAITPLATDPRFKELLVAAFDHALTLARQTPVMLFSQAA